MYKKSFIIFLFVLILHNNYLFPKETIFIDENNVFKFKYNDDNITNDYFKHPKIFDVSGGLQADLAGEHSMIDLYLDQIIEKKKMIESGKYSPIKRDLSMGFPLSYKVVKLKNNQNILCFEYWRNSKYMDGKMYIGELEGEISFFKDNKYYLILLRCYSDDIYDLFMKKSKDIFNYYFKEYKLGYGIVFQSDDKAKELFNAIVKKDKKLPEDLISWYDNFMMIVNTLEIN